MHGMIFAELKRFVVGSFGPEGWNSILSKAGAASKIYLPTHAYPDEELLALVGAACEVTGKPATEVVEGFGEYIVPGLVKSFGAQINPSWKALDLFEHTEATIHRAVRIKSPGATPPELKTQRVAEDEVMITYSSGRRLCALARGIVRGVLKHYREEATIEERSCMLRGDPACKIHVRRAPAA